MPLKARMGELLILGKAWAAKPLFRNLSRRVEFVSTPRSQPKKPDSHLRRIDTAKRKAGRIRCTARPAALPGGRPPLPSLAPP